MNNKRLVWMLAGGTIAFLLMVAYWMFALTLADHMKSYLVPQNKAASYVHALIDADRTPIPNTSSTHSTRPALPASSNTARRNWHSSACTVSPGVRTPCRSKESQALVPARRHDADLRLERRQILNGRGSIPSPEISRNLSEGSLARIIHDGSWRNRAVATRDRRAEPRGREAYLKRYVDRLNGEPACLDAGPTASRLVAAANPRLQQKRS